MRSFLIPAAAAALFAAVSLAAAAEATGKVETVDTTGMKITLEDGSTYILPDDFDATSLKPGATVAITYDTQQDGQMKATAVTVQQ